MTHSHSPPDARLQKLLGLLSRHSSDNSAASDPQPLEGHAQAAVSLVLRTATDLEVLLIKRAESERDPWSGHMALPGGRRESGDPDLAGTAIRETAEETGVELGARGWRLGRLAEVSPISKRLPRLTIVPYVFGVPPDVTASVNSPEVESVMWVELSTLRDPEIHQTTMIHLPEGPRAFPCFQVGEHAVWGLTYGILTGFLELFDGA